MESLYVSFQFNELVNALAQNAQSLELVSFVFVPKGFVSPGERVSCKSFIYLRIKLHIVGLTDLAIFPVLRLMR